MKIDLWNSVMRAPADGGSGDAAASESGGETGGSGAAGESGGTPEAGTSPASTAKAKPEGLQDKHWDADKGQVRLDALIKSHSELSSLLGKRAQELGTEDYTKLVDERLSQEREKIRKELQHETVKNRPDTPEDYQLDFEQETLRSLPENLRNPEVIGKDPLFQWWRQAAHKMGMDQKAFNSHVDEYLKTVADAQVAQMNAEVQRLGDDGMARIRAIKGWMDKNLEAEHAAALSEMLTTADGVVGIETMIQRMTGSQMPNVDGPVPGGRKSEQELRSMMADERYWHPKRRDPAYIDQVTREFRKTYPGRTPI